MTKVLLLSGGIDSVSIAFWKKPDYAITVDYGQQAALAELRISEHICKLLNIKHLAIVVDCKSLGSGDLSKYSPNKFAPSSEWWPYRNQLLVTLGAMKAIALDVDELYIGSVKSDSSHVDGRKEFYDNLSNLVSMQEGNLLVSAPAINMSTIDLVKKSCIPQEILCWAHSCHTGEFACGVCRGCNKHREVMRELGYGDY